MRGDSKYEYHADNYKGFRDELKAAGFTEIKKKEEKISCKLDGVNISFTCLGGGRI